MGRDVAKPRHRSALARYGPDIDGGGVLGGTGEQAYIGMRQVDFVEDQRVVPAPVEIEKRHGAKQSSLLAEGQDAGRVETEISIEVGFRDVNPRNQPVGHFGKGRKLGTTRRLDADFETFRKRVEIVLSRQSGSFLNPI